MILYSYWRSTAAYRARIALNLKGVEHKIKPINLVQQEHLAQDYSEINPAQAVPALELYDGRVITQSIAIIDYLDQIHPSPRLIPKDPTLRSKVLEIANLIAMDVHPINNLRVLKQLENQFNASADDKIQWMQHWMALGFGACEALINDEILTKDNVYACGDNVSLADICIVSQMYNARRWGLSMSSFPKIEKLEQQCLQLDAFKQAFPDNQIDATN